MIEYLEVGNLVVRDDRQFVISDLTGHKVTLRDTFTDNTMIVSVSELNDQILLGKIRISFATRAKRELHGDFSIDFSSYPEKLRKKALDKWAYVSAFKESDLNTISENSVEKFLKAVESETGIKAPSWRTLKRWCDKAKNSGVRGLLDQQHLKGNRLARTSEENDNYILMALDQLKKSEKPSFRTAHNYYEDEILIANTKREDTNKLSSISYVAFVNRAKKLSPYELLASQLGKGSADKLFKENRRNKQVKYILDRAEIDHTRLDLFVVDEIARFPLGRPNITAVLDMKSKSVQGFYVGFEVPSFVSVAKAVKHAISDKTEFMKKYPHVKNEWICKGVFHELAYDRGKEFDSNLLENTLLDIDIIGRGNPRKKPWYKGSVESFFKTINQKLLADKPGKVFGDVVESNEYDPEKNGVISFSAFMEILVKWVVDVYQVDSNSSGTAVPNLTWRLDLPFIDVNPINPQKLDIVFSENITRINKKKGIEYSYLSYDNDRLTKMRRRYGDHEVTVKINREDLSYIYVLDSEIREFFKVPALEQEYTRGIGVYQHKRIIKFHKKFIKGQIDSLSLALARKEIEEIVQREVLTSKKSKISTLANVARYYKVDQDMTGPATVIRSGNVDKLPPVLEIPQNTNREFLNDQDDDLVDDLNDELE